MKTKENSSLKVLATDGCGGGPCPTLYKSQDGKFYIQGYLVSDLVANEVNLAADETLIEINLDLLEDIARKIGTK